jgi:competence protein ComEA
MKDQPRPEGPPRRPSANAESRASLAAVIKELAPRAPARANRLVERWVPGGPEFVAKHRFAIAAACIALLAVVTTAVLLSHHRPVAEAAPALPPAVAATPAAPTSAATLVVSVVGRVTDPGLITLPGGSRVADAIRAAGGALPGTNDLALDLARRLTDGEQIYVGIPVPAGVAEPADSSGPMAKVDLNTATEDQLEALPGVGPAMAQHILSWRSQHGQFTAISQLRDVSGIGDGRYAKLKDLVTP